MEPYGSAGVLLVLLGALAVVVKSNPSRFQMTALGGMMLVGSMVIFSAIIG